jgi:CRP-like cAMP-binding protein
MRMIHGDEEGADDMTEDPFRRNAILAQLPDGEYQALKPNLHLEHADLKHSAYEPGTPIADVYFPLSAVFSLVAVSDGHLALEVATIGHEGMVGLPVYLGASSSPQAAFCQVSGDTARISVTDFRQALHRDGALHALLGRFTQATMVQVAQNVVCNRNHSTQARMARWLLTTQDRVGRDEFDLTQEFLAQMLGVHRPTVSDTAQRIQAQHMIRYSRGVITSRLTPISVADVVLHINAAANAPSR